MLQQTRSRRYWELIEAGYKPEQILTCPRGDPCWCEVSIAQGHGYVKNCGLGKPQEKVVEFPPQRIVRIPVNTPWTEADSPHSRDECKDPKVCIFHREPL